MTSYQSLKLTKAKVFPVVKSQKVHVSGDKRPYAIRYHLDFLKGRFRQRCDFIGFVDLCRVEYSLCQGIHVADLLNLLW